MVKKNRGLTVPEMLVVCAVLGIIMTLLFNTLIPVFNAWRRSDVKAELQREAMVAVQRISKELQVSDIKSVVILKGTCARGAQGQKPCDAITFLSPAGDEGGFLFDEESGGLKWKSHGIFYLEPQSRTLYLQRKMIVPPTASPSTFQLLSCSPSPSHDRIVARNVESISFDARIESTESGTVYASPVSFSITVSRDSYQVALRTSVATLNDGE